MAHSRLVIVLAFVLAAPVLAGCVTPSSPAQVETASSSLPLDWYKPALAREEGHNHSDPMEHMNASTPNFKVLGHDPLLTEGLDGAPAPYGCGDISTLPEDGRRIALAAGFNSDLVFALVDVTDPTRPTKIGEFYSKGMKAWDAALTPDGRFALVAFTGQPRVPSPSLLFRTPCAQGEIVLPGAAETMTQVGPDVAIVNGLVLVDLADPMKPQYADWEPAPGRNMHSVSSALIDGETWIMGSSLGGPTGLGLASTAILPVTMQHALSYVVFYQPEMTPAGWKLVRISQFQMPVTIPSEGSPVVPFRNGHVDVSMQRHPIDNKLYAYMANWEGGAITIDMSNPRVPVPVGQWMPPHDGMPKPGGDGPCYLTAVHGVMPALEAWDDKHYIFAGQECPTKVDEGKPGGSVFIIDNTDPANPKTVGSWHPPEDTGVWTVTYQASPHYTAIHGRTLYVSLYHGGVWAVDLSDPAQFAAPPAIGVFVPDRPHLGPFERLAPNVEQVDAYPDGLLVVVDSGTGVYTLDFDETDPAPPAPPHAYG